MSPQTEIDNDLLLARSKLNHLLTGVQEDPTKMTQRLRTTVSNSAVDNENALRVHHRADMADMNDAFRYVTQLKGQINEAYNANSYMLETMNKELRRVTRLAEEARKEVYVTQARHIETDFRVNYRWLVTWTMVFTFIVTQVVLILTGLWKQETLSLYVFVVLVAVVLVVYFVVLGVLEGNTSKRRRGRWHQYYWTNSPVHDKECDK